MNVELTGQNEGVSVMKSLNFEARQNMPGLGQLPVGLPSLSIG